MTRIDYLPSTWHVQGPWLTDAHAPVQVKDINNGDLDTELAPEVANAEIGIESHADIIELSFDGHARMFTEDDDTAEITTVDLCTNTSADKCNCPDGSYFDGPPLQDSDGLIFLALTGSLDGTKGNDPRPADQRLLQAESRRW